MTTAKWEIRERRRLERYWDPSQELSLKEKIEKRWGVTLLKLKKGQVRYALVKKKVIIGWGHLAVVQEEMAKLSHVSLDFETYKSGVTLQQYTGIAGTEKECRFILFVRAKDGDWFWKFNRQMGRTIHSDIEKGPDGLQITQLIPVSHFEKF